MIKLFFGQNSFGVKKALEEELTKIKDAEVSTFEEGNFDELLLNLTSQSFFSGKRVFVVKNMLKNYPAKEQSLIDSLKKLPDDTSVILVEENDPKKSVLYKFVKQSGETQECGDLKNFDLVKHIKKRVCDEGGDIAPLAAERLATYVGSDLWQLDEEIKKLVLYKKDGPDVKPIQTADVDELVKANFEANIFALLDAIAGNNRPKSTELLNCFLESGENEIYILTMIAKQFRNIAMAKFENGITEKTLSEKAGIHPFVAKKSFWQAKNFGRSDIIEVYRKLVDADLKLKSGFEPKQVLLRLIV